MYAMLKATLLPHQVTGVEWVLAREKGGCILADDMGLGKTVQCCAVMCRNKVKTLVIAPLALMSQWVSEIEKHTTLKPYLHQGQARGKTMGLAEGCDVILTTPQSACNDWQLGYADVYNGVQRVIIDEAHVLRNEAGKIHQGIRKYFSEVPNRILLSGTPVCNSETDVISLIKLLKRPPYSDDDTWRGLRFEERVAQMDTFIKDFVLRRTKEKELPDLLPEISILDVEVRAAGNQGQAYTYCLDTTREMFWKMLRLRQVCNDSQLITGDATVEFDVGNDLSSKTGEFLSILNDIPKEDKVVVFSQWTTMLYSLQDKLDSMKKRSVVYHGGMSIEEKEEALTAFKTRPEKKVLFINLKAGGCGLNLVEANHAIIMEPYFNYAYEKQAIDRVYRIGQKKRVFVYRLYAEGTIETWVKQLQKTKLKLTERILHCEGGVSDVTENRVESKRMLDYYVRGLRDAENDNL